MRNERDKARKMEPREWSAAEIEKVKTLGDLTATYPSGEPRVIRVHFRADDHGRAYSEYYETSGAFECKIIHEAFGLEIIAWIDVHDGEEPLGHTETAYGSETCTPAPPCRGEPEITWRRVSLAEYLGAFSQ